MNLLDLLPLFPRSISLRDLAEATGYPVAWLRTEAQRLYGDGSLSLFAEGAELHVRREPGDALLTTDEAAERLGISVRRVQALITAGRLPAEKRGRDWLIREPYLMEVADRKTGRPRKQ